VTEHPFPTTPPPKLPGDNSSSSSSSSGGDWADPDANPPDGDATGGSTRRKLPKVRKVQTDDERVDEDLRVATFYLNDENYPGAYLRAKDAVKVQPDYSATHFALAQVAEKMKKKDEAIAEYKTYLKLDPDGEKAKAAKKALAELH
jgi:tetratricopeptide (TPR) repeat protein